ncbi:MAG: hypothetical protein BWY31_01670 [Lentisphaerae bacterium ADurb.Bin242]|nr:MAG: hypothetical protein BWY31_01670 [Lentisphaerae bacterium ADurb.Bin242]
MTRKQSAIFTAAFLLALTLLAVAALTYGDMASRRYSARNIRGSIPSFKPEDVAKITVSWRNVRTNLVLKGGRWGIEERGGRPASVPRITELLHSLSSLYPVKVLQPCTEEILAELRLTDDDPKQIPGVRVVLRDAAGQELFHILLGKGHFVRPEPGLPPSQNAEGRYVRIGNQAYLITKVFENCHPVPGAWVEPLRLGDLRKALQITSFTEKDGKSSVLWSVARGSTAQPFEFGFPPGKKADNRALSVLADKLSKPFSSDFCLEPTVRILYTRRLRIVCSDGFRYTLHLADGGENQDIASLEVAFKPESSVDVPGETPAQKKQRLQALQSRFDYENRYYNGYIFLISKEIMPLLSAPPEQPNP